MSRQSQLNNLQDDQRSKSLDDREKALKQKEALLDDTELLTRLDILDKQIDIKQDTLATLNTKITSLTSTYEDKLDSTKMKLKELDDDIAVKKEEVAKIVASVDVVKASLVKSREEKTELHTAISDAKTYLKEQQVLTDVTINGWNDQLKDFQDADKDARIEKDRVVRDTLRLEQDKTLIEDEIERLSSKLEQLDNSYNDKVATYTDDLETLRGKIDSKEQTLLELDLTNKAQLDVLNIKEHSLNIKEHSLVERELNLKMQEKRLNMKLGLSGVSLE